MGEQAQVLTITIDREFIARSPFPDEVLLRYVGKMGQVEMEQHFALSADQPSQEEPVAPAIDLDRMCEEAMDRLRAGIARHEMEQQWEWRKACADRAFQSVMREALRDAIEKHLGDLLRSLKPSIDAFALPIIEKDGARREAGATL